MRSQLLLTFALMLPVAATAQTTSEAPICAPPYTRSGTWERARKDSLAYTKLPGHVAGEVVDPAGRPVPGAVIALKRSLGDRDALGSAQSDTTGRFRLDSILPGRYVLDVLKVGQQRQWHAIRILGAAADTICLRLRAIPLDLQSRIGPSGHSGAVPSNGVVEPDGATRVIVARLETSSRMWLRVSWPAS